MTLHGSVAARPAEIAELLDQVRFVRRQLTRTAVSPGAPAAEDEAAAIALRGTSALTERVLLVADLWTLVACEQLASVGALIRSGEHVFGTFPLARSVIEHSAAVIWVLDPAATPEQRWARAALAVDHSNEELVTAAAHLADHPDDTYAARRDVLRQHRLDLLEQFPVGTDLDARPVVVAGQVLLSPTDLVRHFAAAVGLDPRQWEGIYDYLCAAANHPTLAAFELFEESAGAGPLPVMTPAFLERLVRSMLAPCLLALDGFATHLGCDRRGVDGVRERSERLLPSARTDRLRGPAG